MPVIPTPQLRGSPPPISSVFLRDFTGGINLSADDIQLPLNQFADALDIDPDVKGGFFRRSSFRSLGNSGLTTDATKNVKFLMQFPDDVTNGWILAGSTDGTHDRLATWATGDISDAHARTSLLTFTTDANTPLAYRWTGAIIGKANVVGDPQLYIHRDYLTPVQAWTTANTLAAELTASALANYNENFAAPVGGCAPSASIVCTHLVYLFHGDTREAGVRHPSRIRWSHPGQPEDYRVDDFLDVAEGTDNDRITAMVSNQGRLFIFKRHSVWLLDGLGHDTFSLSRIANGVGAVNHAAACAYLDGCVFFDEALGMQRIKPQTRTWQVSPMWDNLARAMDDGRLTDTRQAVVAVAGTKIAVSGMKWKGATAPNRTFVYDENVGTGWWCYSVGFSALAGYAGSAGRHWIMGCGPFTNEGGASTTYQNFVCIQGILSSSTDDRFDATNAVTYNGYMFCPWVDAGDPARKKRFRRFSLTFDSMATNKSFTVDAYRNWSVDIPAVRTFSVAGLGTATPGIAGQQNNVRGGALGTGYSAAVKITGPNDVAWGINQVTFRFVPKRVT